MTKGKIETEKRTEYTLTAPEVTIVNALVAQRMRILAETGAALQKFAQTIVKEENLDAGEYDFQQREGEIVLIPRPPAPVMPSVPLPTPEQRTRERRD